ncbi:glycine zipper family protein [Commensalibacter oyaizuii]|uniref:Glycine zipper family protein n=1 Tax=Commensalibacter oyaizuii TaxID=3043873 RepID=A0ABT6Q2S0_9PROT|nr:glycine zipper family protein [Commensalibacter sp. TBRC 16381]MDI2091429.1 glycine zipper family protein [Commensalibacter sp. TBRC 16381]
MKFFKLRLVALTGSILALVSCAETPMGPRVQMLPPSGKSFEQFSMEKQECQRLAAADVNGQASHQNKRAIIGGVLATAAGAGLGGALGGGSGAGIGAAAGALGGGLAASNYSDGKQGGIQTQYDQTYTSCMVAKGNKMVPNAVVTQPSGQDNSVYAQ